MSADTRKQAREKLAAFLDKIGYPEHPRDYSSVTITRDNLVQDAEGLSAFELRRQLKRIGKPVDRQEWDMTAQTVNAYDDPQKNTINFPAGIAAAADVRPHDGRCRELRLDRRSHRPRMTHGFDDQGSKFDAKGNLPTGGARKTGSNSTNERSASPTSIRASPCWTVCTSTAS